MNYVPPKGPKRGVSVYSYSNLFILGMTLEDCFRDMYDMDAHGVEILGNSHIKGYPELTDEFLNEWHDLCEKYEIIPAEYGHWIDGRMWEDRMLTVDEAVKYLERDFKIAHDLGFHCLRTKQTVINDVLDPVENWRDIITAATPAAEKYDVVMLPEIHSPTLLDQPMVQDFVEYIDKTGTKAFGLNIDFSVFSTQPNRRTGQVRNSKPEGLIPFLPYVKCCHAKFTSMVPDDTYMFREEWIPYPEILKVLKDNGWDGWMVAEYEGKNRDDEAYLSEVLHQHQILMKNVLGY